MDSKGKVADAALMRARRLPPIPAKQVTKKTVQGDAAFQGDGVPLKAIPGRPRKSGGLMGMINKAVEGPKTQQSKAIEDRILQQRSLKGEHGGRR
jgi:hypothetical protein